MKFHRKPLSESSSAASASSASAAKAQPTAATRRTKAVAASVSSAVDEFDNQNDNRNHDDDDNQLQQTLHCKQILEEITDCTENGTLRNISACVNGSLQNGFAFTSYVAVPISAPFSMGAFRETLPSLSVTA